MGMLTFLISQACTHKDRHTTCYIKHITATFNYIIYINKALTGLMLFISHWIIISGSEFGIYLKVRKQHIKRLVYNDCWWLTGLNI